MSKTLKWRAPQLMPVVLFKKKTAFPDCVNGSGDPVNCNTGASAAGCGIGGSATGGCTNGNTAAPSCLTGSPGG